MPEIHVNIDKLLKALFVILTAISAAGLGYAGGYDIGYIDGYRDYANEYWSYCKTDFDKEWRDAQKR